LSTKSAGIRTHTLVCFSCALLMMVGVRQADWVFDPIEGTNIVSDPARMAHGILTGIGFLGAGVIFRQGNAIQGLTTAASVWMSAALGILYGAGLWELALASAAITLIVLVLFRVFHFVLPSRLKATVRIRLAAQGAGRDTVTELLRSHCLSHDPMAMRSHADGSSELATSIWMRNIADGADLMQVLVAEPGVQEVEITPVRVGDQVGWT
jgi:putative Mg2+ transporter-C (MgtC) family protein